MSKNEINSGWDIVPKIKLIVSRKLTLGPGGSFHWNQTDASGPYWRIYWNDAPGSFVFCNGREVELTPKKVAVLSPDAVYSTRAEKLVNHFYVHCFVSHPFSEIKGQMFILTNPELIRQASNLAMRANQTDDNWRTQTELMVYLDSVLLAIPSENIPDRPKYSPKISRIIEILDSRQQIANADLARTINMSRNGFLFLFRKETGMSPQIYSRQLRLNEACVMLQHSDKSIDEIAKDTGFCDRYHFSREFHKIIGCTPVQFRSRRYP